MIATSAVYHGFEPWHRQ